MFIKKIQTKKLTPAYINISILQTPIYTYGHPPKNVPKNTQKHFTNVKKNGDNILQM